MKNFTTLFTAILMTFAVTVFANDDVKVYEGSVVLENGETLEGQIQMLSPTLNEVKVKFIASNGKATTYKAVKVSKHEQHIKEYVKVWSGFSINYFFIIYRHHNPKTITHYTHNYSQNINTEPFIIENDIVIKLMISRFCYEEYKRVLDRVSNVPNNVEPEKKVQNR